MINLLLGDCLERLRELPDSSVHACVTDPPYGLSFMGKRWDTRVPGVEVWREVLRVLKPGGHLLAFFGTRTYHRGVVAIEDAGFEIRDQIGWAFGSGFPKSHDVSKAIDATLGAEREIVGVNENSRPAKRKGGAGFDAAVGGEALGDMPITAPATPEAHQWAGWGTALKPAWEPIVVARKPLEGTVAANVLEHGTGGINVDGCRVGTGDDRTGGGPSGKNPQGGRTMRGGWSNNSMRATGARWPANLIHDGSDEVVGLFPVTGPAIAHNRGEMRGNVYGGGKGLSGPSGRIGHNDDGGSAARFFYCAKASKRDRDSGISGFRVIIDRAQLSTEGLWAPEENQARLLVDMEPSRPRVIGAFGVLSNDVTEWSTLLFGSGKTDQFQQGTTCTIEMETNSTIESKILSYFQRLITSENTAVVKLGMASGGSRVEIVKRGSRHLIITSENLESAHGAEDAVLKTQWRISVDARRNDHVTVKPTDLMRYLCRLVTPPGGVVLDPFMGSGSTGKAAILEGFRFVGIEREAEYHAIAESRIRHVMPEPPQQPTAPAPVGQLTLW